MVINGDPYQTDLNKAQQSGLGKLQKILEDIDDVSVVEFDKQDIVRSQVVIDIVHALDKYHEEENNEH
jgi:phosphate starvation-inducible PhoH-like protein